jgi:hypothetical protein
MLCIRIEDPVEISRQACAFMNDLQKFAARIFPMSRFMMSFMTCRLPTYGLLAVAVASGLGLPGLGLPGLGSGMAAAAPFSFTWDGGGANNNWTTGSNWVGNVAPTAGNSSDLTFSGSTRPGATVNSGSTFQVNSITFDAGATTTFTIGGGNASSKIVLGSITNSSAFLQNIGNLSGNPIAEFSNAGTIDTGVSGLLIQSLMAGTANISKTGPGQLEISNAKVNTYSGLLTASSGSVLIAANIGSADVVIDSGAILNTGLAGSALNNLTVSGTLLPGSAVNFGDLTLNGNLTLNPGSTTALAVGESAFDSVLVTGTTTFGGALAIAMVFEPTGFDANLAGDAWTLFGVDTANLSGNFTSVTMSGVYGNLTFSEVSSGRWESPYLGSGREFAFFTSGPNAGVLYAVPEPSTMVFAGIGMAMLGWSTWTRRRSRARLEAIEASLA